MRVGVVGAGAIGGLLAGELAHGGAHVVVVDPRAAISDDYRSIRADGSMIRPVLPVVAGPRYETLGDVEICLVAVKSDATAAVAAALAAVLPETTPVVSFQNGILNLPRLRERFGSRVTGGVVTYNVRVEDSGRRRQTSAGKLLAGMLPEPFAARLRALQDAFLAGGERLELRSDIEALLAGKLLVNLNNGVCAATGIGIAQSLSDRDARWCYAQCIDEGTRVMRAAGMTHARVTALPARLLSRAMRLPDWLITRMTRGMVSMDPDARSSTLQDLDRGRRTEIEHLNGAIVALSQQWAVPAPLNRAITQIVKNHELRALSGERPAFLTPLELRDHVGSFGHCSVMRPARGLPEP